MRINRMYLILAGFFCLAITHFGWKLTARDAYESAAYTVDQTDGRFEIREYPELTLATTPMKATGETDDGSFMRLFGYISGGNEQQQKVAMTTPVFMTRPETYSDTGTSERTVGEGQMAFMLPEQVANEGTPKPSGERVEIKKRPAGRYAVIRFAGRIDEATIRSKEQELRQWMVEKGLRDGSTVEVAGYDPPWTPGPLRRNEVLIRLSDDPELNQ